MKKFALLCSLALMLGNISAQTTKGTWVLGFHNYSPGPISSFGAPFNLFPQTNGFGISFGTAKGKIDGEVQEGKETATVIGLSLNSLYFAADQFAIGLVGSFSFGSTTDKEDGQDDDKSASTIFLLGPEMRYYLGSGSMTKFWLKAGAAIGSVSSKYNGESGDPTNLTQIGGGAGISIFPVPTVSIDFGLGYNVLTTSFKSSFGKYQSINSGLVMDIGVGIFF